MQSDISNILLLAFIALAIICILMFVGNSGKAPTDNSPEMENGNGDTNTGEEEEDFYIGPGYIRTSPFYTTTFQAYPGLYMTYDSSRASYCLQQHNNYAGYKNCMLYMQ